jgi:hypothetical protein
VYEDAGIGQCGEIGYVKTIDNQEEGKVIGKGKDISYEEFKKKQLKQRDFKASENKIKYGFSPITGKMNQELGDLTYNLDNDKNIDGYLRESYEIYLKKGFVSTSELGLMEYSLVDFYLEGNAEKKEEVASALLKNKEVKLEEYYHNKQYETGQISSPTERFLSDGFIRSAHQIKKWVLVGESVWVETSPGSYVLTNLATSDVIKSIKTGDKALENVPIYGLIWQGAKWVPIKFYNALPDFIKTAVDMWVIPEGLLLTKNIVKSVIAKEGGTALKPAFYGKADGAGAREILIPDAGDLNKKVFTKPDTPHHKTHTDTGGHNLVGDINKVKTGSEAGGGYKHFAELDFKILEKKINFPDDLNNPKLPSKFEAHKEDFGMQGANFNKESSQLFKQKMLDHINDPNTIPIAGQYNKGGVGDVVHFYNPKTSVNIMKDTNGNWVSGWKLSKIQREHIKLNGKIGGGEK